MDAVDSEVIDPGTRIRLYTKLQASSLLIDVIGPSGLS
jgi:hypothetical protein